MPRKLLLIPMVLTILALACGPVSPSTPPPVTQSLEEEILTTEVVPVDTPAGQVFVPNVSTGEDASQSSSAQPEPAATLDPQVLVEASATTLRVGETLKVTGKPVGIGLPYYYLIVRDEGVQDAPPMVQITYDNQATPLEGSSQVLEFISAQASMESVTFEMSAKAAGITTVMINATGEVPRADGTAWGGEGSGIILITVNP